MDKFFIQAAFKSLDEIDLEENKEIKKALIESRLKEAKKRNKKSYIKKVAEDDFEQGKTFDIDDFSQFKKLCKEDGYIVTEEDFDFYFECLDEIRENNFSSLKEAKKRKTKKYPLAKGEHLNTCAGDPDINTAAFNHATDIGASSPSTGLGESDEGKYTKNNIDGLKTLDEKLPKDLARAYKSSNSPLSRYADRLYANEQRASEEDKHNMVAKLSDYQTYNLSPIDFENASYKEITKDEAMKYAKPKKCWQLVLVFGEASPRVIRFDKNGKALNAFYFRWEDAYIDPKGARIVRSTQIPLKQLIQKATKIYLTDEQDHLNDKYFENNKVNNDYAERQINNELSWDLRNVHEEENNLVPPNYSYIRKKDEERAYERNLRDVENNIKIYLGYLQDGPKDTWAKDHLEKAYIDRRKIQRKLRLVRSAMSKQISPMEYAERKQILDNPRPQDREEIYNTRLQKVIILKNLLKDNIRDFNDKSGKYLAGQAYTDNWDYRYYTNKIKELEAQIKKAQDLIAQYNKELSKIDKEAINDKIADELSSSYDKIKELNSKLVSLGGKSAIKEAVEKNKFNLSDPDDVQEAIHRKANPEKEDDLVIIHPMLNHKKPAPGNAILTCKACNEVFYFDKDELKQDEEDPSVYNKDIQCENCGAQDGYDYIGDVSTRDSESAKEVEKERKDIDQDDFVDEEPKEQTKEPKLETVDDLEEPEEIVEESFDKLANKYFNKVYENVDSYKTTGISQKDRNKYIIEGVLTDKNKKEEKISFLLETLKRNKDKVILQGSLKELIENKAPFRFCGRITENKLLFESMRYRYVENIDKDRYLVEGLEINR